MGREKKTTRAREREEREKRERGAVASLIGCGGLSEKGGRSSRGRRERERSRQVGERG